MDESQWLVEWDPNLLLKHFRRLRLPRKRRLFAAACCRRVWDQLIDERSRRAVETSEAFADGQANTEELLNAYREARQAMVEADASVVRRPNLRRDEHWQRFEAAQAAALASATRNTTVTFISAAHALPVGDLKQLQSEFRRQADLIRDIFGNPFRRVAVDPAWLAWNHGTVPAIARHIYDDRAFHDLPILADALEDAGCTNTDLLDHCRGPGPHVRGCWAVDLLLGKS
jgi:hypothetical protein